MKRLPTEKEWKELFTRCTWIWEKFEKKSVKHQSDAYGWRVYGPSGNSIGVLITTDAKVATEAHENGYVPMLQNAKFFIQTSEKNPRIQNAYALINSTTRTFFRIGTETGRVHLVDDSENSDYIDLGLSVKWQPCSEYVEITNPTFYSITGPYAGKEVSRTKYVLRDIPAVDAEKTYVFTPRQILAEENSIKPILVQLQKKYEQEILDKKKEIFLLKRKQESLESETKALQEKEETYRNYVKVLKEMIKEV